MLSNGGHKICNIDPVKPGHISDSVMTRTSRMDFKKAKPPKHEGSSWAEIKQETQSQPHTSQNTDAIRLDNANFKLKTAKLFSKKYCLKCKQQGHLVESCPERKDNFNSMLCYNCGSTDHSLKKCNKPRDGKVLPYATCFICDQNGHLASKCPGNRNGIYPKGGGCRKCGSNMHRANDCTELTKKSSKADSESQDEFYINPRSNFDHLSADAEDFTTPTEDAASSQKGDKTEISKPKKGPKIVVFR